MDGAQGICRAFKVDPGVKGDGLVNGLLFVAPSSHFYHSVHVEMCVQAQAALNYCFLLSVFLMYLSSKLVGISVRGNWFS